MQLWLSLDNLKKTYISRRWISKINDTSLISAIKGITLRIAWLNAINYAYFVLKVIYVCNLLHHNTGNSVYVITYPVQDMNFYALLTSAWSHPPEKSVST